MLALITSMQSAIFTALRHEVGIGHRSQFEAEVLSGIEEGARVVVHPTNQISDGSPVEAR